MDMADHVKYIDESNVKLEDKFLLEGEPWLVLCIWSKHFHLKQSGMDKLYLQAKLFLWKYAQLFEINVKSMIQYRSLGKL